MNIFYLDHNPIKSAMFHNNKHVVKMIVETAQILSTAHRILDGELYHVLSKKGRKLKRFKLNDSRESVLYKATHINHRSVVWARKSEENYKWLFCLFESLLDEYTFRYCKVHKSDDLKFHLSFSPKNIDKLTKFSEPPQAMPDYCKDESSVIAYRNYYRLEKSSFNKYTKRQIPEWLED